MVISRKSALYWFRFQGDRNWNQCNTDSWIVTVMFENDLSQWGRNITFIMVLMCWVIINLKYNRLEIWWRHQKNHVTLVAILVFLKNLVLNHIHAKFHILGLTCSGFMIRDPLAMLSPPVYLMSKETQPG